MPTLLIHALANGLHVECYGEGCDDCDNGWIREESDGSSN